MHCEINTFCFSFSLPDVSAKMSRFCRRLRDLIPLDMQGDVLLRSTTSTNQGASLGVRGATESAACLSRKEMKKVTKRAAKRVRQQEKAKPLVDGNGEIDSDSESSGMFDF